MNTLEQWYDRARGSIQTTPEKAMEIAVLCHEAEANGGKASTWHMSTIVHDVSHCCCYDCSGPGYRMRYYG